MTINRRDPKPMKDSEDIQIYNNKIQEQIHYQLLTINNDKFEMIRLDILKRDSLPLVEAVYTNIRWEVVRLQILKVATSEDNSSLGIGIGLVAKMSGV